MKPRITLAFVPTHALIEETRRRMLATTYVVRKGDTLREISRHLYGDATQWPRLRKANRLDDTDIIYPGQTLIVPRD